MPESVTKGQRAIGKVQELALAYGGGAGAFGTFAQAYGFDLDDLAKAALPSLPSALVEKAEAYYYVLKKEKRSTYGMSRDAFVVCDTFKRAWRKAHSNVEKMWSALEANVTKAMEHPNQIIDMERLRIVANANWLHIKLPSGRRMCYARPQISEGKLSYLGTNQYTRKWERIGTYGAKIFENLCQAVARDVLADAMPRAEAAGYEIVLGVHDELITETPDADSYNTKSLSKILATNPPWSEGLPLAAAGFETTRYKKD